MHSLAIVWIVSDGFYISIQHVVCLHTCIELFRLLASNIQTLSPVSRYTTHCVLPLHIHILKIDSHVYM